MSEYVADRELGEPPEDSAGLVGFPCRLYESGFLVYRVHRVEFGPWYFSNSGAGRFDLTGTARGTCYLAVNPITAVLEVLESVGGVVCDAFFADRRIRELRLPRALSAADTRHRHAARFHLTREIGAEVPYDRAQRWAHAFDSSRLLTGIGGISYWPRHDLDPEAESIALFGKAGERRTGLWKKGRARRFDAGWFVLIEEKTGIVVLPTPDDDEISVE